jgi:hypothetical protein
MSHGQKIVCKPRYTAVFAKLAIITELDISNTIDKDIPDRRLVKNTPSVPKYKAPKD